MNFKIELKSVTPGHARIRRRFAPVRASVYGIRSRLACVRPRLTDTHTPHSTQLQRHWFVVRDSSQSLVRNAKGNKCSSLRVTTFIFKFFYFMQILVLKEKLVLNRWCVILWTWTFRTVDRVGVNCSARYNLVWFLCWAIFC